MHFFNVYLKKALVNTIKAIVRARFIHRHGTYYNINSYLREEDKKGEEEEIEI
jgi:hypothetical protein